MKTKTISLEEFLDKVTGVKWNSRRDGANFNCPCCEDNGGHGHAERGNKAVVATCHKCKVHLPEMLAALSPHVHKKCPPKKKPRRLAHFPVQHPKLGRPEKIYTYTDAGGEILFLVCRFKDAEGRKSFSQCRPDGGSGWTWGLGEVKPVLYHLPELLVAVEAGFTIYIAEGEKDVATLRDLGLAGATCNPMGAGKWREEFSASLAGADVVILPDQDEPGQAHAQAVALSLVGKARSIKVLNLPGPGKDVSDWIEQGGDREQLESLAEATPVYEPTPEALTQVEEQVNASIGSDKYSALILEREEHNRLCYDHRRGRWLVWSEHFWSVDNAELHRIALTVSDKIRLKMKKETDDDKRKALRKAAFEIEEARNVEAMLQTARNLKRLSDSGEGWDSGLWLLAVRNGVIELKTGTLRPGRPEDRITKHLDLNFVPKAKCSRWLQFLDEIFSGKQAMVDYIHRAVGYSLTGDVHEKCLFLCHGEGGDNGKSVFLNTLTSLFGPYAGDAANRTFTVSKYEGAGAEAGIAKLDGARFVTALEIQETEVFNAARIKRMTGGDPVTCKRMHENHFTYKPQYKIWLTFNVRPRAMDDRAFFNRVQEIPFLESFDKNKEPDLEDKLLSEAPGILTWAVKGCLAWQKRGKLDPPAEVIKSGEEYKRESDRLSGWLAAKTETGEGLKLRGGYPSYDVWCDQEGVKNWERLSGKAFAKKMAERFHPDHDQDGNFYWGLCLRLHKGTGARPVGMGKMAPKGSLVKPGATVASLVGRKKPTPKLKVAEK